VAFVTNFDFNDNKAKLSTAKTYNRFLKNI